MQTSYRSDYYDDKRRGLETGSCCFSPSPRPTLTSSQRNTPVGGDTSKRASRDNNS